MSDRILLRLALGVPLAAVVIVAVAWLRKALTDPWYDLPLEAR